ncbi:type III secretion system export apparatus subunit SctV [Sinorhizobium alkalisoli]|uniref:EscV/YscV/HrcV family type III secretion system export apparatus protein n=1 Tax=Sinorhizobium alkalisoli TaxID=1752398 RepID=A0A1E3V7B8_9HYPH|nr:type III secretion system export apparatus subunit SctV [Sinorhizobium alkalisoli]ODR89327.1 EscV/YscV/HrcV family type III secretion system export apparatus protein [Sinorhizobium alkalisoli]
MSAIATVNQFARAAARRSDVVVAALVMLAITMMIIPLPTYLVDALIGFNFFYSLLILIGTFYVSRPVQFSSLPSIILLGTLFRLALSITTTRLILTQADAGQIVSAFGDFVVGGDVLVGLVVFLIITVAQFVVITKGAERVAEVGARFALDAMPGKQMSIDNEARSGEIDQQEARRKRDELERESQFYGAMDGAMKFVKGDAVAGLIIIAINLIGGLTIGSFQRGLTIGEAAHTYSLLTVGDGLIAQMPALMMAVAAGAVVTRVPSGSRPQDLSSEILGQLGASDRALALAAAILFGFGLVPGFPLLVFWFLAAAAGLLAYAARRRGAEETAAGPASVLREAPSLVSSGGPVVDHIAGTLPANSGKLGGAAHRITVSLGEELAQALPPALFAERAEASAAAILDDLGIRVPAIGLHTDPRQERTGLRIAFEGVPVLETGLPLGHVMVWDETVDLDIMAVPYVTQPDLLGLRLVWVEKTRAAALDAAGVGYCEAADVIVTLVERVLRRYAPEFIDAQEVRAMLGRLEEAYGDLIREVLEAVSAQKLAEVLRRLVEEDVPITNMRIILQAIAERGAQIQGVQALTDSVRVSLARQICFRFADSNRIVSAYLLTRPLEDEVRTAVEKGTGPAGGVPEQWAAPILDEMKKRQELADTQLRTAILTSIDIRRHVRNLLARHDVNVAVLSYQEISSEFSVQCLGYIALPVTGAAELGGVRA